MDALIPTAGEAVK